MKKRMSQVLGMLSVLLIGALAQASFTSTFTGQTYVVPGDYRCDIKIRAYNGNRIGVTYVVSEDKMYRNYNECPRNARCDGRTYTFKCSDRYKRCQSDFSRQRINLYEDGGVTILVDGADYYAHRSEYGGRSWTCN